MAVTFDDANALCEKICTHENLANDVFEMGRQKACTSKNSKKNGVKSLEHDILLYKCKSFL